MAKAKLLSLSFLILFMQGCSSCGQKAQKPHPGDDQKDQGASQLRFGLSPQILLAALTDFSYQSSLQLSLTNLNNQVTNTELVSVKGAKDRLHMTKKIDDSHFFEIMNEGDLFLVKSRNGDWRSGSSNKAKYQSLIADGLNLLPWLMEQFSLDSVITKLGNSLEIKAQPVPAQAPFMKLLKNPPTESTMSGLIELDSTTGFLSSVSLNVSCTSGPELLLKLSATINLAKNLKLSLIMPSVSPDEALLYPVNIATRFKNLMDQEQKQ